MIGKCDKLARRGTKKALFPAPFVMGGTGLEPVTPSLSIRGDRSARFAAVRSSAQRSLLRPGAKTGANAQRLTLSLRECCVRQSTPTCAQWSISSKLAARSLVLNQVRQISVSPCAVSNRLRNRRTPESLLAAIDDLDGRMPASPLRGRDDRRRVRGVPRRRVTGQFAVGEEDTRRQGRRSATLLRLQMTRAC